MAVARKRTVLDLSDRDVVHLEVLPEKPLCFGSYEVDLCTGEFCQDVFSKCKETSHAGNASSEKVSIRDKS